MSTDDFTSIERFRRAFNYDPRTGEFTWAEDRGTNKLRGTPAGHVNAAGYRMLQLGKVTYRANRVAFALMTGHWPAGVIDHVNGDRLDNSWANLRDVTQGENTQNRKRAQRNNRSGFLGVSQKRNGWEARIKIPSGKMVRKAGFETPELAHEFYLLLKEMLHPGYVPDPTTT